MHEKRCVNRDGGFVHRQTMEKVPEKPFTWKARLPIPVTGPSFRLLSRMWTGDFMTLGDADNFDMRSEIVNECNTVALGSALISTVMLANMVAMPEFNIVDDLVANSWGTDVAWFFYRSWQPIHLSLITMQVMAMVYCIFVLIALGELTGDMEVRSFSIRIGAKLSGGFVLFLVSLTGYAIWMMLFAIFYNPKTAASICYILIPFMVIVMFIAYLIYLPVLMELYNVKLESRICKPLVLTRKELRSALDAYVRSIGDARQVSPTNFVMFLTEATNEQMQLAFALFCSSQDTLPTSDTAFSLWEDEDHNSWVVKFKSLQGPPRQKIETVVNLAIGGHRGQQEKQAVVTTSDKQLIFLLKDLKVASMGIASVSYMTKRLMDEEIDALYLRLHPSEPADDQASGRQGTRNEERRPAQAAQLAWSQISPSDA